MKEYQYTGKAMGTDFSISIVCDSELLANTLVHRKIEEIRMYEKKFSRFIPESELSLVNQEKKVKVSKDFIEVLKEAIRLFYLTGGVFNPLVQIEKFGYDKNFQEINQSSSFSQIVKKYDTDVSAIQIDELQSIVILQKEQKLDFGGFLKGYLAEKLSKEIFTSSKDINGVIVNIGGDLHTQGVDESGDIFIFEIYNPLTQKNDILVPIQNQSLATSGTYKRTWETKDQKIHHILDSTGLKNPNTSIVSASVITDSGGESEAFTKVFISFDIEKALKFLATKNFNYVIIQKDGTITKNIS